jgi:hypothetical protein
VEERVARYGHKHKQVTRRRILEAAGRRFKRDGVNGSGVATLMNLTWLMDRRLVGLRVVDLWVWCVGR